MSHDKSNHTEPEKTVDIEETSTDQEQQSAKNKPKRFVRFWLFLLLILCLGAAFFFYTPQELKDKYLNLLTETLSTKKVEQADVTTNEPSLELIETLETPSKVTVPKTTIVVEHPAVEKVPAASSEEISHVLHAMTSLQQELETLRQNQQSLQQVQQTVQTMQLRARLNWISNPSNHLPQLQLAWEEITLMPVLSSDEREQAQKMLVLAEKRVQDMQNWQQHLHNYSALLKVTEHHNIIPKFENRWLNWIAEQFSIRPSLNKEEAERTYLREQLMNINHNIELEQWPDAKLWLRLRATLQLTLDKSADTNKPATELGLPESFKGIQADIDALRQSAAAWLERLS